MSPLRSTRTGREVTPRRAFGVRHPCDRGRQPEQRLRNAGRVRTRDEAGNARRRAALPCLHGERLHAGARADHAVASGPAEGRDHRRRRHGVELAAELHRTTRQMRRLRARRRRRRQGPSGQRDRGGRAGAARAARAAVARHRTSACQARRAGAHELARGRGAVERRAPDRRPAAARGAGGVGRWREGAGRPRRPRRVSRRTASSSWSFARRCRPRCDDDVFALGDCAACPWPGRGTVPPRAQAAHQQAHAPVPADPPAARRQAVAGLHATATSAPSCRSASSALSAT